MNKDQRAVLAELAVELELIRGKIEDIAAEEQDKFDNLSEGLQASERGQAFENNSYTLTEAVTCLEEAIGKLEEIE
jgi:hypothetical protein